MNVYKICLVEDEESLNNLMKSYIEKEGYEVIQFFKGLPALEYIGKEIHIMTFWGNFLTFEYEIYKENGYLEYVFNYDILGKKCLKGDCSNPKKEYFLETYYNKFISY